MIFADADSTRFGCPVKGQHCAGSLCACWRWAEGEPTRKAQVCSGIFRTDEPARPTCVPATWGWVPGNEEKGTGAQWLEPIDEWKKSCRGRRGYCGLGGKPEFGYADEN